MGIVSHIRLTTKRNLDVLNNPEFEDFRQVFDGRLKQLTNSGLGQQSRQSEPITVNEEELLWKSKAIGDHNPRVLINTILYLNGRNFALRSGKEHRGLRFKNSQITLIEPENGVAYLQYREDISKTCQGGLKHSKIKPKVVQHHENLTNSERCHVRLYKLYMSLCPKDGRDDAFYLTPLKVPTENCWYSRQAMGHNTLQKVVPDICKKAGITGFKSNHSLRVTTATRLYTLGVDEQQIMNRTGHRSVEGVRCYKRTSEEQKRNISSLLNGETEVKFVKKPKLEETVTSVDMSTASSTSGRSLINAPNSVINVIVQSKQ